MQMRKESQAYIAALWCCRQMALCLSLSAPVSTCAAARFIL